MSNQNLVREKTMYINSALQLTEEKLDNDMIETHLFDQGDYATLKLPTLAVSFESEIKSFASKKLNKEVKISYVRGMELRFYTYRKFMIKNEKVCN